MLFALLMCFEIQVKADVDPTFDNDSLTFARLGDMDLSLAENGWGTLQKDKSIDGNTLTLNGTEYAHGIGSHATFKLVINLNAASRFHTIVGIDDEVGRNGASVNYSVTLIKQDGTQYVASSGNLAPGANRTAKVDVETTGYKYIVLEADDNGSDAYDHVDWVEGYFVYNKIVTTEPFSVSASILSPSLNCATQVFAIPGVRFMQKLRAASEEASVSVSGLPDGLKWNEKRQLVDGVLAEAGTYSYTAAVNVNGQSNDQIITITCSDNLAQPTPFMGLLTWNVFEDQISADKVYAIADAFEEYGLLDAGYEYVCLDDQWAERSRDAEGRLQYAAAKFPEGLNVVADYVHGKGLKFGVYSDGGSYTCSGAQPGSYQHEETDAKSFVDWGFDLLKYDYCNNPGSSTAVAKNVYGAMGKALKKYAPSTFIFYLCEWGYRNPWEWGSEAGGTCWRATDDTRDCWTNKSYKGGVKDNIDIFKTIWQYNGVNRWNDADMVMCGLHGKGKSSNAGTNGQGMTQNEYRTQFALWCMWSSPITLSFDVTTLGGKKGVSGVTNPYYAEDLAMITNKDLIALNQDRLGQAAEPIAETDDYIIFMKDLENGDVAISVTNLNASSSKKIALNMADFPAIEEGVEYLMHDCWTDKTYNTIFTTAKRYSPTVAPHATKVFRMIRQNSGTDGIKQADSKKKVETESTYDLSGRKVSKGHHGLVIRAGQKKVN